MGFQAGMIQRSISSERLTWDNQWNGSEFNTLVGSSSYNEFEGTSANAFDLSTGFHWDYAPTPYTRFNAGLSMFHITAPDIGFTTESKLLRKYTLHGGGEISISEGRTAFTPNFVTVIQGANKYTDIGGEFKMFLQENSKFTNFKNAMYMSIGPYFRWSDAAYIVARYGWNGMIVSLSYDFNVSGLSAASGASGGLELMLGYKMDMASKPSRGHRFR